MAPRFLIDENLSPRLALHLRSARGYDAAHANELGLAGRPDAEVLACAIAQGRIVVTANADDFRRLGRARAHPGLAVLLDARGWRRQVEFGAALAEAVEARLAAGKDAAGRLFEVDRHGTVRDYALP